MLRSLFSGITGLRSNQTALDVTGNNIANANTIGFKSAQTIFQDAFSQNVRGGSTTRFDADGNPVVGGNAPSQIGLGVTVAGIQQNMGQGAAQLTNRPSDLMIQGDGFFVVQRDGQQYYTRAGAFTFDANGYLTGPNGAIVQGYADDGTGQPDPTELVPIQIDPLTDAIGYSISGSGLVSVTFEDGTVQPIFHVAIADFATPAGLNKAGETMFTESLASGLPVIGVPGQDGNGTLLVGALEGSNVDLAQEFTNLIIAQRGFQAASRVITTSDEVLQELVNIKR